MSKMIEILVCLLVYFIADKIEKNFFAPKEADKKIIQSHKEKLGRIIDASIEQHKDVLHRKYKQTHYIDDYGVEHESGWDREIKYFVKNIVEPKIRQDIGNDCAYNYDALINTINSYISQMFSNISKEVEDEEVEIETGVDYENYIERILQEDSFIVNRTPATGDQGVDLIATKNGKRIAIQCKFYSKSVGNKAVQEVVAGKDFYECDYACVVSNNSYTPAAKKLASVSNVLLLNEDNIVEQLDKLLGQPIQSSKSNTNNKFFTEKFWKNITVTKLTSQMKDIGDINMRDEDGNSFLICAAMHNCSKDIIKTLITLGADITISNNIGYTVLMAASANSDDTNVIKYLINQGADINAVTDYGDSALIFAAGQNDNSEIVKMLIASGADVNIKNEYGVTPLMAASNLNENVEIVKMLIASGAKVNALHNDGHTALILACNKNKNIEVINTLIAFGAKVNVKDNDGNTPLIVACANKASCSYDIIKTLIQNGAKIDIQNNEGNTALIYAVLYKNMDVIKSLLDVGADVNVQNNKKWTSLMYAIKLKDKNIIKLLIASGAELNHEQYESLNLSEEEEMLLYAFVTPDDPIGKMLRGE